MFSKKLFLICIFCVWSSVSLTAESTTGVDLKSLDKLPSSIPTCKENDLNINDCLKAAFQQLAPRLKEGLPELNIPPLDPFVVEKSAYQYSDSLVQGRVALRNVHIYGMSNIIIEKVNFKLKNRHMSLEQIARIPSLYIEGSYKADMKLNEVKLTPKGYFNITMTDITLKSHPEGEIYERDDGHSYLKLTKFDADPDVGDMHIYANGIFPDPSLNAVMLDFVNQYWRTIYKSIIPSTRSTWEPIMINSANEFLSTIPIDLLLTKD